MTNLMGKILGQYHILEEIGRGGMAVVYRAYQPSLQRYVAIKVLPQQFTFDTTFVQRFQQEARAAARLEHPNIVTIHDVGEQQGIHYIVMQELHGLPLNKLIQQEGQMPLPRVARIVGQIASALDYAHSQGFVHRDIKPSNIIVEPDDQATLTDFGIAKAMEGARLTRTGTVMGTPEYMSPEQAKGEAVGPATDVYSLGIVTYEMLAGRVPFEADSTPAILHKQAYERPEPVRTHAPHLPSGVEGVLSKALAKEPEGRFQSAGELACVLQEVLKGKLFRYMESEPPTIAAPVVGKKRPGWVLPVFGGLAVLILVALAIFGLWSRGPTLTSSPTMIAAASETASPSPTQVPPTDTPSPTATATAQDTPTATPEPTVTPTLASGKPQIVTHYAINVYSGPGNSYAKVGQTNEGQTLDVIAQNPESSWWRVCCIEGEPVWIEADLVEVEGVVDTIRVMEITLPASRATSTHTATPTSMQTPIPKATPTPRPTNTATRRPPTATRRPTPVPTKPPMPALGSAQCPHSGSCITSPSVNATLAGVVPIVGTADMPNFQYYKFEYRPEGADWRFLVTFDRPMTSGTLMEWWTMTVSPGTYWLRMTVVDKASNYLPPAELRVHVAPQ